MATLPTALVLGDGDFAFSSRLAAAGTYAVTATTIDSEAELEKRYPDTFPTHRRRVVEKGGTCAYGVDARQLRAGTDAPYTEQGPRPLSIHPVHTESRLLHWCVSHTRVRDDDDDAFISWFIRFPTVVHSSP